MLSTQEKDIDGFKISVSQLPAIRGYDLFMEIVAAIAPAASKIWTGGTEVDMRALPDALSELFQRANPKTLKEWTRQMFQLTTIDNSPILDVMDVKLQGRMLSIMKIQKFAFEVNFLSFTEGQGFGEALRGLVKQSPSKE